MFHPHLRHAEEGNTPIMTVLPNYITKEDTKRRSKYILTLIELNFAGIKFRGWPSCCVSRELNFADDPKNREIREN